MTFRTMFVSALPLAVAGFAVQPALAQTAPVSTAPAATAPAASIPATPAPAAGAAIQANATIKDTAGGMVGTVVRVDGDNVVVRTDRHELALPASSFTADPAAPGTYLFAMTQAQLNAKVDQAKAAASQAMTVGAVVRDAKGGTVGTVEAIDPQFVTVKLATPAASSVQVPVAGFANTPTGPVLAMTAAELQVQASAATVAPETEPAE